MPCDHPILTLTLTGTSYNSSLDVHVKNKGARAFYDKLGFSQCGDMPGMLRLRRRIR